MARDTNLYLVGSATAGTAVSANGNSTAINVPGGEFAVVWVYSSVTPTDSDETIDILVKASCDGTNYGTIGGFPQLVKAANKGNAGTWVAIPVYIPRAEANPAARGTNTQTKVRLNYVVGGTTPSFTLQAAIEPLSNVPRGSVAGFSSSQAGRYGPYDNLQYFCT